MAEGEEERRVVEENMIQGMFSAARSHASPDATSSRLLTEKVRTQQPLTWFHLWLELGKVVESKRKICTCAGYYSVEQEQTVQGLPVCQCKDRRERALKAFAQVKKIIDRDWQ